MAKWCPSSVPSQHCAVLMCVCCVRVCMWVCVRTRAWCYVYVCISFTCHFIQVLCVVCTMHICMSAYVHSHVCERLLLTHVFRTFNKLHDVPTPISLLPLPSSSLLYTSPPLPPSTRCPLLFATVGCVVCASLAFGRVSLDHVTWWRGRGLLLPLETVS